MAAQLLRLDAENFRSLRDVSIPLGDLTVLVGPNGVGKSNVLKVFSFLADIIRTDLQPALESRGGFDEVAFWGGEKPPTSLKIGLTATWTTNSTVNAPDNYELTIRRRAFPGERGQSRRYILFRQEKFVFKRTRGRGRRITVSGEQATVTDTQNDRRTGESNIGISKLSSGLSTLPRLARTEGGAEVTSVARRLSSLRVFDVDVDAARRPSRAHYGANNQLAPDARNLADFLFELSQDGDVWDRLLADARSVLPQLRAIEFAMSGGSADEITVILQEKGLRRPTPLADASYGTVRLLGLLALLYDPHPAALTCVEEIDHGLHPQALELLVERLREASRRSQFLVATHSPALADRLRPEELIICERDAEGASVIPALTRDIMRAARDAGLIDAPEGTNQSYTDFVTDLSRLAPE
ncbi:AAA family ATPase [Streptomyces sp. F63]|uniref:AAA family ATPase n=1 Tax=Streptomyces sp. F63 TaxID=2824887 RepID=UPI001B36A6D1|nr:AAA family ATPase [Streptomyces sp. F63]MBQ0988197.1 AAA family ATPase [Streptomyces sp. F63]